MTQYERFFGNPFSSPEIIPIRLYNFGLNLHAALVADNPSGHFDDEITNVAAKLAALALEIGDVDTALNLQKGSTITVDGAVDFFKGLMSTKEGVIAEALGGKQTEEYQQFYPHGKTEYSAATKEQMTMLTGRVFDAAVANATALGPVLSAKLQQPKSQWNTARNNQLGKMAVVDDNRTERTVAFNELGIAALQAIHRVAYEYPGDITKASSYVDFSLLHSHTHHVHKDYSGTIPPSGFAVVVNRSFTDEIIIHGKNTDDNADLRILLLHDTTSIPTTGGKIIKAGKSASPKPSTLGSLDDTFLVIVNMSTVNELTWAVEITG